MDNTFAFLIAVALVLFFLLNYLRKQKKVEAKSLEAAEKGKLRSDGPQSQHPHVDATYCIGCAACTLVCPEGDVLAMLGGKAVIVNGFKCIGHSLCAEVCPVGAITMVMASPSMGADLPRLTPEFETNVKNMFIVGELGGLALIKNAINQGRDCVDNIANRLSAMGARRSVPNVHDVLIVGAGPAGISASLRAIEKKLNIHADGQQRLAQSSSIFLGDTSLSIEIPASALARGRGKLSHRPPGGARPRNRGGGEAR